MRYLMLMLAAACVYAQPIRPPAQNPVTTTAGVGHSPEQGAIFEVKQSGAAFVQAFDATPYAIFATAGAYNAVVFANPAYSTDLGDGFEIISLQNGTQEFNVGCGGTGPKCMDFTLDPVTGKIQFDVNAFTVAMSGATASTISEFHTFGGTGTSTLNIFEIKAFPDPDAGGGHITSQLEAFMTATADTSSNQSGSGITFETQSIGGTGHGGYRLGVNAIYTTAGTVFSNNGFTLFDYENSENIFIASTIRAHSFQLGDNISLIIPKIPSLTGTRYLCIGTDGVVTSSALPCSGT